MKESRPGPDDPCPDLADLYSELRGEIGDTRTALRKDMTDGFTALGLQIAGVRADLMKWSFVFWVGAVLAIASLAGVRFAWPH